MILSFRLVHFLHNSVWQNYHLVKQIVRKWTWVLAFYNFSELYVMSCASFSQPLWVTLFDSITIHEVILTIILIGLLKCGQGWSLLAELLNWGQQNLDANHRQSPVHWLCSDKWSGFKLIDLAEETPWFQANFRSLCRSSCGGISRTETIPSGCSMRWLLWTLNLNKAFNRSSVRLASIFTSGDASTVHNHNRHRMEMEPPRRKKLKWTKWFSIVDAKWNKFFLFIGPSYRRVL